MSCQIHGYGVRLFETADTVLQGQRKDDKTNWKLIDWGNRMEPKGSQEW